MSSQVPELTYTGKFTSYSREALMEDVRQLMSEKRWEHVLRVEKTALKLAEFYGENLEKTSIAALTHDIAKERPDEEMRDLIISENLDLDLLTYGNNVWHGPVGANIVQTRYEIMEEDILDAIRHHTVGSPQMCLLEKIIYVADYIEPGRDFPAAEEARRLAFQDLDAAVSYETEKTLEYLIHKKIKIYPKAIETYNHWVATEKEG